MIFAPTLKTVPSIMLEAGVRCRCINWQPGYCCVDKAFLTDEEIKAKDDRPDLIGCNQD